MPLTPFAEKAIIGAIPHKPSAKEVIAALNGGGGVSFPVDEAQDAFNNVQIVGTNMPNLVGSLAGYTGYDNIAIGLESYDAFGSFPYTPDPTHYALAAITEGLGNIAIGGSVLMSCTTGAYNIGIGDAALISLTTGSANIVFGDYSGYDLTEGTRNVLIGTGAAANLTTGNSNVVIGGPNTAFALLDGSDNVLIGKSVASALTSGSTNVMIGKDAGDTLETGTDNVCIGNGARPGYADTSLSVAIGTSAIVVGDNSSAIGAGAFASGDNQCVLGGVLADKNVVGFSGDAAPADGDIYVGQGFLYWDLSGSDVVLKFKGKAADGTVVSKTVTAS